MIGGAISAGLSAVGSIFGGISASKAMKRVKNNLEEQRRKNQDWYDRRYNEDATQRADAQAILTKTEESIRNRNKQAAGTQAVMGGTEESVAAAKGPITRLSQRQQLTSLSTPRLERMLSRASIYKPTRIFSKHSRTLSRRKRPTFHRPFRA